MHSIFNSQWENVHPPNLALFAPQNIIPRKRSIFPQKLFHIASPGRLIFDVFHKFGLIFISLHISDCAPGNKIAKASGILSKTIRFHQF